MRSFYLIMVGLFLFFAAHNAYAAPVTFSSSTPISLTSPSTTLMVATGSVADSLTVTATSAAVTMSASTGGSFTLTSPSYDLAVATSSGGGTISNTCSSGLVTLILSQLTGSTIYTITPAGMTCSGASAPIISSITASGITSSAATITWTTNVAANSTVSYGVTAAYGATSTDATLLTSHAITISGLSPSTQYHFDVSSFENGTSTTSGDNTFTTTAVGVPPSPAPIGVSGQYGPPGYVPGTPIATSTGTSASGPTGGSSALENEISSLLATLCGLVTKANAQGFSSECPSSPPSSISPSFIFTRNLTLGSQGSDVTALQEFLIKEGSGPAAQALQSYGSTGMFWTLTRAALAEYQKSVGITPAVGYFGPITRAYVNQQ